MYKMLVYATINDILSDCEYVLKYWILGYLAILCDYKNTHTAVQECTYVRNKHESLPYVNTRQTTNHN